MKRNVEVKSTIRNLGSITQGGKTGTMYTLTAVASDTKTDFGESTKRNVRAYASVTWIDNLGFSNEFVSTSGS